MTPIGVIEADHLILPGDGFIYAFARTDRQFIEHRKFSVQENRIVEVKQPFLYVGLDSQTNEDFMIYATQEEQVPIASIRKGERVFVVLNDGENYLIRSHTGLLGWRRIEDTSACEALIEGVFFAGD